MLNSLLGSLLISLSSFSSISAAEEIKLTEYKADIANCYSIAEEAKIEDINGETFIVTDYDGNEYFVKTGASEGFMVYDPVSNHFMEKSSELVSPYDFSKNAEYFYFGPMNYFEKKGDSYYSIYDDEYVDETYIKELQDVFNEQLITFRNHEYPEDELITSNQSLSSLSVKSGKTYIENYEFVKYGAHPSNYDGSCGFVAASIVLNYWEKTMYEGTILPQYLDENGDLNDTRYYSPETNLKDKLVEFNGGEKSSWGKTVRDALIDYAEYANLSCIAGYYFFDINMRSELKQNHPVIIFGSLPDPNGGSKINHAVTAYGLDNNDPIVNYGWGSITAEVTLSSGLLGSVTTFKLNDYEETVSIAPTDYKFDTFYNTEEVTEEHYVDGFNFSTTRLRTGYIKNEYITLSPRKEGYGTAYLEYNFSQPVSSIDVDLTFWSNDERYYISDNPTAIFEYRDLYTNTWSTKADLLDIDLPTDRTNPARYTFSFPGKTKSIRFYTHFESMSGWKDRNKGRICIGDMDVHTYF